MKRLVLAALLTFSVAHAQSTGAPPVGQQPPLTTPGTLGTLGITATITGVVGGFTGSSGVVQLTGTTTTYSAGQTIGPVFALNGLVRTGQTTALIQNVRVAFASAQTNPAPTLDMVFYGSNPTSTTASTTTANAALSGNAVDNSKALAGGGAAHITDCTSLGTPTLCQSDNLAKSITVATGGGSVYAALVTRAPLTLASATDVMVLVTGPQD